MNGSQHIVGGVGYSGEIQFVHRNLKYATLDGALKQPDGVVALSVFLNVSNLTKELFIESSRSHTATI
jgi:hypothetical protein